MPHRCRDSQAPLLVLLRAATAQIVPHKEIAGTFHPGHNYLACEKHNDTRKIEETIPRENHDTRTPNFLHQLDIDLL